MKESIRQAEMIGELVIERLHALVRAGYQPRLGEGRGVNFIHLIHPGKAPEINLWSDGQIVDAYPTHIQRDEDRTIIDYDDAEGFQRFLDKVPSSSTFQRLRSTRLEDAFLNVMLWTVMLAIGFGLTRLWDWLASIFHIR